MSVSQTVSQSDFMIQRRIMLNPISLVTRWCGAKVKWLFSIMQGFSKYLFIFAWPLTQLFKDYFIPHWVSLGTSQCSFISRAPISKHPHVTNEIFYGTFTQNPYGTLERVSIRNLLRFQIVLRKWSFFEVWLELLLLRVYLCHLKSLYLLRPWKKK